jgi:mRNA-degrading endonuclease YafQ of YafQ-DinJ toxin-antitoxin module
MKEIGFTNSFKKDYKKAIKRGLDESFLEDVEKEASFW